MKRPLRLVSLVLWCALLVTRARAAESPRVFRDHVEPHWFTVTNGPAQCFWYRTDLPSNRREFTLVNAEKGTRAAAFDAARVAKALGEKLGRDLSPDRLPVDSLDFAPDLGSVVLHGEGKSWTLNLATYALGTNQPGGGETGQPANRTPRSSRTTGADTEIIFRNGTGRDVTLFWSDPDGNRVPYGTLSAGESRTQHTYAGHVWIACARDGAVLGVFEADDSTRTFAIGGSTTAEPRPRQARPRRRDRGTLSPDGKWEAVVRRDNLFLRSTTSSNEFALTTNGNSTNSYARSNGSPVPEVFWSPDSRHLVALRNQPGSDRRVYVVESSPADQLQPKLQSFDYLKPGDRVPISQPHLFDVDAHQEIALNDSLFTNPWSITDLRWDPDSGRFTFLFNQRGHQTLRILAVNAQTGDVKPIVEEHSKTFIDYSGKLFVEHLDDTGELIWMSERDGWNHLYLYDTQAGTVKNQITRGDWVVRKVDRVDAEKRQVWFQAGGIIPGQDPYYLHTCRVNFDGTGLTVLTSGDGSHTVQFSPDRRCFIDTWSRVNLPPVTELRRSLDGKLVCPLETAEAGEITAGGWQFPEPFVAKGRDGTTDICGVIWRPRNFDSNARYPVIENIYAGPQDSFAPKSFRAAPAQQRLADRGFIVVQLDGMGTANRSRAFHDVCWKNLADSGFPDRILWIKAAAAKHPQFDLTRVGIYGTSAGGQNALRGLLDHGDFYQAGVADSGCHDNRMDKIWWNEQWLGWPVDESYVKSSNVVDAHKLRGKLLLMAGELDHNVDPASTMQVVNALIKADKDFELLIVPGGGHGIAQTPYGSRRLADFFVRTLLKHP
ncbi:MAG: DPP IV N-terminal domain-containing protein [Verrucomicrobiota bacterium]